jgi:hypothetical protein
LHTEPGAYLRQAPAPLQVPSRPHVETSTLGHTLAAGGGEPFGTKEQVPGAAAVLHALHVAAQAVLQQTPSTQNPLTQSPPQPQAWPLASCIPPVPLHATSAAPSVPASRAGAWLPVHATSDAPPAASTTMAATA